MKFTFDIGTYCRELVPNGCFAYSIDDFFPLVMYTWKQCLVLNKKQPISVCWANLTLAPLGMPKWVWPSMNPYRTFFVQTLHHLQAFTEHGRCCMQYNQLPTKCQFESRNNCSRGFFNSMGLFVRSWSLILFDGCFAYSIKNFFPLVMHI